MPYGITQCYLPPYRNGIPAFTSAEAGLDQATPEGCNVELTQLSGYIFYRAMLHICGTNHGPVSLSVCHKSEFY